MSLDNFIGQWEEEKKDGFEDFAKVIGLPNDKTQWYSQAQTEIAYSREGDEWVIKVGVKGIPNGRVFRFKLGEPYDSADIDGSPMKSLIQACGNQFKEKHAASSLQGEEMEIVRWIENDKMIVETSCKGATMKSLYNRVN
ncbi:hypothetical protein SNE40_000434 [Patella caerulea]|uniref:Uncharacterized protein n=1 Tax=Patella caerulea TaxID=87958 RepID=A0AAN8KC77_PATCE